MAHASCAVLPHAVEDRDGKPAIRVSPCPPYPTILRNSSQISPARCPRTSGTSPRARGIRRTPCGRSGLRISARRAVVQFLIQLRHRVLFVPLERKCRGRNTAKTCLPCILRAGFRRACARSRRRRRCRQRRPAPCPCKVFAVGLRADPVVAEEHHRLFARARARYP